MPKERPRGENVVDLTDALQRKRWRRRGGNQDFEEGGQEAPEGRGWSEGNADADRRQEAGEEAGGPAAAEVGVRLGFLGQWYV